MGLVVVALLAGACGDDAEPSASDPTAPSTLEPASTTTTTQPPAERSALTEHVLEFDRLGPVVIGMTVEEATQASGITFHEDALYPTCSMLWPSDGPGVWLFAFDDRIAMISVEADVRTLHGLGVGSSATAVVDAFGAESTETKEGRLAPVVVEVMPTGPERDDYRLVFEFDNDGEAATRLRAGRMPEVVLNDEGCA